MEGLTLFKIAQFTILLTFAVFVSDLRKKKGMIPLVNILLAALHHTRAPHTPTRNIAAPKIPMGVVMVSPLSPTAT